MNRNFIFVTYKTETGEIDQGSGIYTFADIESVEIHFNRMNLEFYDFAEITPEELDLVRERDHENNIRKHKIDVQKIKGRIVERDTVNVPIEAEGIGGKEIIGYDRKPVGVIVESDSAVKEEEAGRD